MAVTKAFTEVNAFEAVAQADVHTSAVADFADGFGGTIGIQLFLDGTTAHTGTEIIVQTRQGTDGKDWHEWFRFVALIDASPDSHDLTNTEAIGATVLEFDDTQDFTIGGLRAIENGTIANSEILTQIGLSANTSITISPGLTHEQASGNIIYTAALSQEYLVDVGIAYVRLIVNNNYDADGCTCCYRFTMEEITAMA